MRSAEKISTRGYDIDRLPYRIKVYVNNQVLIPAKLTRSLGITNLKYADVVLNYRGNIITLRRVKLLRTKHTDSRQFTIPKDVRDRYGIKPGDEVEILQISKSEEYE